MSYSSQVECPNLENSISVNWPSSNFVLAPHLFPRPLDRIEAVEMTFAREG
jgi:hypothetical protein